MNSKRFIKTQQFFALSQKEYPREDGERCVKSLIKRSVTRPENSDLNTSRPRNGHWNRAYASLWGGEGNGWRKNGFGSSPRHSLWYAGQVRYGVTKIAYVSNIVHIQYFELTYKEFYKNHIYKNWLICIIENQCEAFHAKSTNGPRGMVSNPFNI